MYKGFSTDFVENSVETVKTFDFSVEVFNLQSGKICGIHNSQLNWDAEFVTMVYKLRCCADRCRWIQQKEMCVR